MRIDRKVGESMAIAKQPRFRRPNSTGNFSVPLVRVALASGQRVGLPDAADSPASPGIDTRAIPAPANLRAHYLLDLRHRSGSVGQDVWLWWEPSLMRSTVMRESEGALDHFQPSIISHRLTASRNIVAI